MFTVGEDPETAAYSSGSAGSVFTYRGWKVGLAICFDIRFPPFFHQYAKAEVDVVLVSACWVGGPHKTYQFKTLNSSYAILTQAYLAAVNRSGRDPAWEFDGAQYVFSPFGEDFYDGKPCRLDPQELQKARRLVVRPSDRDSYSVQVS